MGGYHPEVFEMNHQSKDPYVRLLPNLFLPETLAHKIMKQDCIIEEYLIDYL